MEAKELLTALKEVQGKCIDYGNACVFVDEKNNMEIICPYYDANYGCILKEYPERWRI